MPPKGTAAQDVTDVLVSTGAPSTVGTSRVRLRDLHSLAPAAIVDASRGGSRNAGMSSKISRIESWIVSWQTRISKPSLTD
jgi:hypothetical protein